jgi:D-beta-D-heptose 7-phosphate kinase/D-beta-D-heptose 1-phosphate adenosyltransferase
MSNIAKKIESKIFYENGLTLPYRRDKKYVFTNGCFDILHRGHIESLIFAKSQGDLLIVGLNSDKSVEQLKPGRPINGEYDRAFALASLEFVDRVVIFDKLEPTHLIFKVRPDYLVKGEEYKGKRIAGSEFADKVIFFPMIEGKSTTGIIEKIIKTHEEDQYSINDTFGI